MSNCVEGTIWVWPRANEEGHTLHFLFALYEDYGLYEKCHNTPLDILSLNCKNLVFSMDTKILYACGCWKRWIQLGDRHYNRHRLGME